MDTEFIEMFAHEILTLAAKSRELESAKKTIAALEALLSPSPVVVEAEVKPLQVTGIETEGHDG